MSISSVSSNVKSVPPVEPQTQLARAKEVENDHDKDDGASKVAAPAPTASVNTSGQIVGSTISTKA
jgi:hypothetical protein